MVCLNAGIKKDKNFLLLKNIGIIGSGFASMSAAAVLSKAGFDVHVFEKNNMRLRYKLKTVKMVCLSAGIRNGQNFLLLNLLIEKLIINQSIIN